MKSVFNYIFNLSRPIKRIITLLLDAFFIFSAFWGAWIVRVDNPDVFFSKENWVLFFFVLSATLLVFIHLGLYLSVLRYIGNKVVVSVLTGCSISVLSLVLLTFYLGYELPRSIPLIYFTFLILFIGGSRFSIRLITMHTSKRDKTRVVVYGSGPAGRQLAQLLMHGKEFDPVAFIDDDKNLQNTFILGRPVYSFKHLVQLSKNVDISKVLLAMPNIGTIERKKILTKLEPLALEVKSIPDMSDLVSGDAKIDELRDVAIDDLLGREAVEPRKDLLGKNISNKVVMVTGAGGSIGSELCRQIIQNKPKILILFELSEFALYTIHEELTKKLNDLDTTCEIKPIIGSVQDSDRIYSVLSNFSVNTIYHAAAYKHVPLVEYNVIEGVKNNVFGTYYAATAALKAKVETFVLISTDKAVRPTNIMGTTKRVAELVLQALNKKTSNTTFCMVRFGNVLGSSGSVVPLFKEQISKGGPVTITHKDITRYFMTIPEASQLVIQAGAMAKGGEVFVLDMGESVKISDLAVKMIHLMGLEVKSDSNPFGDIELQYSGLRPGEKLYEELLIGDNSSKTDHLRINKANEISLEWDDMQALLDSLDLSAEKFDVENVQRLLKDAPTGYLPTSKLCDLMFEEKRSEPHYNSLH
ncbi:nucleoside-diphosphate sugar epimerase [Marinomonas sp. S3726]|uniref:polysaccharide biosynthesis protein n=1 Tax=Marinomonas sp. S3726 TaxID=579484 RepID=UPI0005F9B9AF|nr:nucleoside-diphosphate sugar epimerase/dehydratase [Marinomonas sp. S3726]KJZ15973.1 nucleoside-diphosphate sugar epimerase [Marinomonas sp. S3726]